MDTVVAGFVEATDLLIDENFQELADKYMDHLRIAVHGKEEPFTNYHLF